MNSLQKFLPPDQKNQVFFIFPCADASLRQEGRAQLQTSRHQSVESFDAEEYPQLWARRGDPLLILKLGKISGVCVVNLIFATTLFHGRREASRNQFGREDHR